MPNGILVLNKKHYDTPLQFNAALSLYGRSKDKSTIDELHNLAISVSSNRTSQIPLCLCHVVIDDLLRNVPGLSAISLNWFGTGILRTDKKADFVCNLDLALTDI